MKYDEFIDQVLKRAQLSSKEEAVRATKATLEALSEYISWKERHDAASQLPQGVKNHLKKPDVKPPIVADRCFSTVDQFVQHVSALEGVPPDIARKHAQVVLSIFRDALSEGEFEDIRAELPPELYNEFFAENK
ncbi:MAG TPA: DUF2267 domain-containing protein [Ktedonobacteraceae bacterium]|jgi:uncharacterized protein (DUF2267 family)